MNIVFPYLKKTNNFIEKIRPKTYFTDVLLYEIRVHMCTRAIWRHMYVCIVTMSQETSENIERVQEEGK